MLLLGATCKTEDVFVVFISCTIHVIFCSRFELELNRNDQDSTLKFVTLAKIFFFPVWRIENRILKLKVPWIELRDFVVRGRRGLVWVVNRQ